MGEWNHPSSATQLASGRAEYEPRSPPLMLRGKGRFLNLSTADIGGWIILCGRGVVLDIKDFKQHPEVSPY